MEPYLWVTVAEGTVPPYTRTQATGGPIRAVGCDAELAGQVLRRPAAPLLAIWVVVATATGTRL